MSTSFLFLYLILVGRCACFLLYYSLCHHEYIYIYKCITLRLMYCYCMCVCVSVAQNYEIKEVFNGSRSLTNRSRAEQDVPPMLKENRSKKYKNPRKLNINDDANAMQSQPQTRRRQPITGSTLNTVQLKQHGTVMAKQEANRLRSDQQKQTHLIPKENLIIGICTKVFRKCFFPTQPPMPVSVVSA